ncbi:MAG: GAF domain-containing protein [Vicinamibacterales bacterium]|nr:GAF domain-containing protein [Vicinamibacterales bacterium]
MTPTLESLATCFQGLLPAQFFTCSADGVPNAAYLSHVDYVDASHVALSFQFFNKSRRNIAENPRAMVMVPDPDTGQGWCLRLRYVRSETSGPLFDRMALRIEAIASYCGLKGIFKLRAADVYEVLGIEAAPEETGLAPVDSQGRARASREANPIFTITALQDLASRLHGADSLEALVDSILEGLDTSFGFKHSMMLVPTEEEGVLVTIATRGYAEDGAGAEVRHGEGIGGLVAEARKPIRVSGLMRGMLYALAMHKAARATSPAAPVRRIALPGLPNPESQLGVPLLVRGELVGVLCLESEVPYRFHEEDKASIELLGSYLAIAIQNVQWQEREAEASQTTTESPAPPSPVPGSTPGPPTRGIVYYEGDDAILVDDEYLIRGLPARILWRLLRVRETTGREEFTNRELRLDKSLQLPEWKDNLESRLLLLRRRLDEKRPDIRIVPRGRGRFALQVTAPLTLTTRE